MMMIITLVVLAVVVFWVIGAYNGLIALKNQTLNAWKQIDVQLKRRYDLIPNLVNTVKGAMEFERETLEAVVQARSNAMQVASGGAAAAGGGALPNVKAIAAAETALTGAVGRFFAVMENYPALRSSENIKSLQEELASTENKIAFSRQFYNDVATKYNIKQQQFPTNMVAPLARAVPAELWEIEDAAERQNVKVDLSMGKKPQG
jgi:LemA protein